MSQLKTSVQLQAAWRPQGQVATLQGRAPWRRWGGSQIGRAAGRTFQTGHGQRPEASWGGAVRRRGGAWGPEHPRVREEWLAEGS